MVYLPLARLHVHVEVGQVVVKVHSTRTQVPGHSRLDNRYRTRGEGGGQHWLDIGTVARDFRPSFLYLYLGLLKTSKSKSDFSKNFDFEKIFAKFVCVMCVPMTTRTWFPATKTSSSGLLSLVNFSKEPAEH